MIPSQMTQKFIQQRDTRPGPGRSEAEMEPAVNTNTVQQTTRQAAAVERPVAVWPREDNHPRYDSIAEEVAVALVYNGVSHAVMMASPMELESFALGFSLTEGIVDRVKDVYAIEVVAQAQGIEIALTVSSQSFHRLKSLRRNLTGRSGCGICGAESLAQVRLTLDAVSSDMAISHAAIDKATCELSAHQPLQALTGAVHGAAWCNPDGSIVCVCEDIGRHNAVDKLVGLLWSRKFRDRRDSDRSALQHPGFLLVSSRASYEIVQKSAKAGISMVVAVSAPTSLAIDIADETGITLIGFSRQQRHVAYTHGHRLIEAE